MASYTRTSRSDSSMIFLVIIGVTAWTHHKYLIYVLYGFAIAVALLLTIKLIRVFHSKRYSAALDDIDGMSGLDFELYVIDLLKENGFRNVTLTEKYDMGVDIVANKDGVRWGIQVKRYSGLVKASAVRQVVTALNFYNCDRSMVITNSSYSNVAQRLASINGCVLVDRPKLLKLIAQAD